MSKKKEELEELVAVEEVETEEVVAVEEKPQGKSGLEILAFDAVIRNPEK